MKYQKKTKNYSNTKNLVKKVLSSSKKIKTLLKRKTHLKQKLSQVNEFFAYIANKCINYMKKQNPIEKRPDFDSSLDSKFYLHNYKI